MWELGIPMGIGEASMVRVGKHGELSGTPLAYALNPDDVADVFRKFLDAPMNVALIIEMEKAQVVIRRTGQNFSIAIVHDPLR